MSDLALANVEALAQWENSEFNCSLDKDNCKITATVNLLPKLKEKFNLDVAVGVTVDLSDFTRLYTAPQPNKPRVRCGIDLLCSDLF